MSSLWPQTGKTGSPENLKAESFGKRVVAITLAPALSIIKVAWYPILSREPVIKATCPTKEAVWKRF